MLPRVQRDIERELRDEALVEKSDEAGKRAAKQEREHFSSVSLRGFQLALLRSSFFPRGVLHDRANMSRVNFSATFHLARSLCLSARVPRQRRWLQERTKERNRKTPCTNARLVVTCNLRRILKGGNTARAGSDVRDQPRRLRSENGLFRGAPARNTQSDSENAVGANPGDRSAPISIV